MVDTYLSAIYIEQKILPAKQALSFFTGIKKNAAA